MNKHESFTNKRTIQAFAEGFMNDDLYISLFENPGERRIFLHSFMKAYLHMAKDSYYLWSEEGCYALIYDSKNKTPNYKIFLNYYIGLMKGMRIASLVGYKSYLGLIKDLILNGSSWLNEINDYLHLDLIVVNKDQRGKGLGKKMISHIAEEARSRSLVVSLETHNPINKDMYEHLGFKVYKETDHKKYQEYCMILS